MKTLLIALALVVSGFAAGQRLNQRPRIPAYIRAHDKDSLLMALSSQDTNYKKLLDTPDRNRLPENGMPNAITHKLPPDIYVGNNGKGQDIYRSQLDNMGILKPDSSSAGYIPNAITPLPTRPRITDENGDMRWRRAPKDKVVSGTFDSKGNFIPANPYPSPGVKPNNH
jgi:hypothetical protein